MVRGKRHNNDIGAGWTFIKKALTGDETELWRKAVRKEVQTLQEMKCWDIVKRPADKWLRQTKFLLLPKKDEQPIVYKHKACLVACWSEKMDFQEDISSLVARHFIIRFDIQPYNKHGRRAIHSFGRPSPMDTERDRCM